MSRFEHDTVVTFPSGALVGEANVQWSGQLSLKGQHIYGFITDASPFHPLDHNWQDQPGDTGWATVNGERIRLSTTLTAAVKKHDDTIFLDSEIPAKRGDPDWIFLVFHVMEKEPNFNKVLISLEVNKEERRDISAAHTACHLSSLALNKVCESFWQKEIRRDSLGNRNFDSQFIQKSKIGRLASEDHYRIGKSARKLGLDAAAVMEQLTFIEGRINKQLAEWIKSHAKITITPGEAALSSKRMWECKLEDGLAIIPCGGSHANRLNDFFEIRVSLRRIDDAPEFVLQTNTLLS